jgi:hypothetical protein
MEWRLYKGIRSGSARSANFHALLYRFEYETTQRSAASRQAGDRTGMDPSGSSQDMGQTASDFAGNRLMTTEEAVSFRLATDDDRQYVYESALESLANMPQRQARQAVLSWSDFLLSWHATNNYLVYIGSQKVGVVRWERGPDAMHLTELFLEEAFRRRGAGNMALEFFEQYAHGQGFGKVSLLVDIADPVSMQLARQRGYAVEKKSEYRALMAKQTGR